MLATHVFHSWCCTSHRYFFIKHMQNMLWPCVTRMFYHIYTLANYHVTLASLCSNTNVMNVSLCGPPSISFLSPPDGWQPFTPFQPLTLTCTIVSFHPWLIPFPEHCLFSWLTIPWLILWLVLLNPWPWTLPRSYLYKEPILSCSSLVLTLVPIQFNPLWFAHNLWKCSSLK